MSEPISVAGDMSDRGARTWQFKAAAWGTGVLALLLLMGTGAATVIRPSLIYSERASFKEYPVNDVELESWISEQPGCFRAYVIRHSDEIRITYGMSRNLWGHPPCPDIRSQFERFGYRGLMNYDPQWEVDEHPVRPDQ
jgi:hypothetical protein